jgi:hypothetical protein
VLGRQPLLQLGVPARVLRVGAQVVAEQLLVAGPEGVRGHHVQVAGLRPVLVPVVVQPPGREDVEPLVPQPGQRVLDRGHGI